MIELRDLTKKFGDFTAVDNLSLKIETGEFFGLLGPNGAGKTTTISMLSTVLLPTSGEIFIDGTMLTRAASEQKRKLAVITQEYSMRQDMTMDEVMEYQGRLYYMSRREIKRRSSELLEFAGLAEYHRRTVRHLSGGMKRKLMICRALLTDPEILLLDEPTSALDPAGRIELMQILGDLRRQGKSILLSTHILADMEKLCDEVGFLYKGIISRTVNVRDLNNRNTWIVQLNRNPDGMDISCDQVSVIGDRQLRIVIDGDEHIKNQQNALKWLSSLDSMIVSIRNESRTLEDLFQEVCAS